MTTAEERQAWRELAEANVEHTWGVKIRNQAITALLADVDAAEARADALAAELAKAKAAHTASLANANRWLDDVGDCDALEAELAKVKAQLETAIEYEHGCTPGEFDQFTFHEGPLFER